MKYWIVIAQSCPECGEMAVTLLAHNPTPKDLKELRDQACDLSCLRTLSIPIELGTGPVTVEGY